MADSAKPASLVLDAQAVADSLDYGTLVETLATAFRGGVEAPSRHHHVIPVPGGSDATLLLMPAWMPGRYVGTKIAQVFPDNGALGLPAVQSVYLLFDGRTGLLLATLDGNELTTRRTVAASALAVRYLARAEASRLLIVGTGQIASRIAASHAAVRPIRSVAVWGRHAGRAGDLVRRLAAEGFEASVVGDLPSAVAAADIVSCATLSRTPLILGEWLSPGTHVDLIGSFTPAMREADDAAIRRATIVIDTAAAITEAGDIVGPLQDGVISRDAIQSDLAGLVTGAHPGRRSEAEITLFKSVGAAIEDLAAAALCYDRLSRRS